MAGELWTVNLGVVEYREAWALQERVRAARQADAIPDTLLLLEHPPVYTRGRRSTPGELAMGEEWYRLQGIDVVDVDRGGLLTYHGPGQLVGYPIMRVTDLMGYVRTMEQAIVTALDDEGVSGARGRSEDGRDFIGVWTAERKIASIGVHRSREVTTHGFAVNVDNDLQPFEWVVPCGLPDVHMTSITRELGHGDHLPCFRKRMAFRFAEAFGRRQRLLSAARLEAAVGVRGARLAQPHAPQGGARAGGRMRPVGDEDRRDVAPAGTPAQVHRHAGAVVPRDREAREAERAPSIGHPDGAAAALERGARATQREAQPMSPQPRGRLPGHDARGAQPFSASVGSTSRPRGVVVHSTLSAVASRARMVSRPLR